MSFNLKEYLMRHGLTKRSLQKENMFEIEDEWATADADDSQPEVDGDEPTDTTVGKLQQRQDRLKILIAKKDQILMKYKGGLIGLDQYRDEIGTIPDQIKAIKAQVELEKNKFLDVEDEQEEDLK